MRVSGFWLDVEKGLNVFPPRMLVRVVKLVISFITLKYAY